MKTPCRINCTTPEKKNNIEKEKQNLFHPFCDKRKQEYPKHF